MTRDQAIRLVIDGTVALEEGASKIDITLIRKPDHPEKLERDYRQRGWMVARWRECQMDDGAGLFHLRRKSGEETEAEALFNLFERDEWFDGRKRWENRELLAGGVGANPGELTSQLDVLFASVPSDAVKGRRGWKVTEIAETKEHGTVLVKIQRTDPTK